MISVTEATELVLRQASERPKEQAPLAEAVGRVLAEPLLADRDFPPFTRVSMDGIAIRYAAFTEGRRQFVVQSGLQAAGSPQLRLDEPSACVEVMTGAILPAGADTVVRYEDVTLADGQATIQIEEVREGQNAHPQGSDRRQGDLLVAPGRAITPAEVGIAATVGKARLWVRSLPRTVVLSTGDELVPVDDSPLPYQIRRSNVHTVVAQLRSWGLAPDELHLPDERASIRKTMADCLERYELLILSGGVSKGKLDFVPEVLDELGVQKHFHQVQQRPGKPFWFGTTAGGATVFALPGNPVSTFVGVLRYVQPWLRQSLGLSPLPYRYAALSADFYFKPSLTYFLQVKVHFRENGRLEAEPVAGRGSGDLANLPEADGILELPAGRQQFQAGEVFPLLTYRGL